MVPGFAALVLASEVLRFITSFATFWVAALSCHAETHTVILPHALAYNSSAIAEPLDRLKRAMACEDPAARLFDIAERGGAPVSLKNLGMPADGIAAAVRSTLDSPYYNPRKLEEKGLTNLLENAWHGSRPS